MAVPFAAEPWMPIDYARLLAGFVGGWLGGVIAHELGHAVAARLVGFDVSAVGVGVRRPLVAFTAVGSRVYLARGVLSGGLTFAVPRRWATPRWRYAAMIAGGPAANALMVLTLLGAYRDAAVGFDLLAAGAAAANALMLVATLAPGNYNFAGTPVTNDGGLIARVLRSPDWNHAGQVVPAVRVLLPLWDGLGERRSGAYNLDVSALFLAWLGSPAAGAALAAADERRDDRAGPFERAVAATARGAVARAGGHPDAADHFAAAADLYGDAGDRDAALLARSMRAEAASAAGDPSAPLPGDRPRDPELAGMAAKLRGLIALRTGDGSAADELSRSSPGEDPAFAAWVNRVAAGELAGRDPGRAEAAERTAIVSLVAAGRYCDHPEDRPTHVELVERALVAYRQTVAARGGNVSEATREVLRPAYAESVRRQFPGPRPDEEREREGRRLLLGCTVWVLCAAVAAMLGFAGIALAQGSSGDKWTGVTMLFTAIIAACWLAAAAVSVAYTIIARLLRPGSDARYGTRLLILLGVGMALTALGTVVIWFLHP